MAPRQLREMGNGSSSGGGGGGGSNSTLNIVIVCVTVTIVLIFVIAYFCGKRRQRMRRMERENRYREDGTPSRNNYGNRPQNGGNNNNYNKNTRTFNFNMMNNQPEQNDMYIMRNSDDSDDSRRYNNKSKQNLPFKMDSALQAVKVDYSSIQYTRKLSKGAFGEVWLGQFQGQYVAIKQILEERKNDKKEIECFVAEIRLMASLKHPNVVDFLGFSWNPENNNLCAMTEYMKNGDLFVYLTKKKATLSWRKDKYSIALDIALALTYLHSLTPKVIHRDLKSKNVLLDEKCKAKLSDFGISRLRELEETMTAGVGTALWAAPEVFMAKKYSEKADVYSLGVVLSELDTCAIPYADQCIGKNGKLDGMQVIKQVTQAKVKPTFSSTCPPAVKELAYLCLEYEADKRPSAAQVVDILRHQVRPTLEEEGYLI